MTSQWTTDDISAQQGRTFVITGANSGLGRETAKALAAKGAHVVLAVRDTSKGREAAAAIDAGTRGGTTEVRQLDLASLASIEAFADGWSGRIDVLINNAGIMAVPLARTVDGFETQFGTNHLGHFALANRLLPSITDRVVTVSSALHRRGVIDFDDPNWERRSYSPMGAYGQSKLANLLFTLELARRLQSDSSGVRATAAHPGYASTNLQGHTGNKLMQGALRLGNAVMAQSAAAGALPSLYAATMDLPSDSYLGPDGFAGQRGHPTLVGRSAAASDPEAAKRLWTVSETLTGVTYPDLRRH